jgi:serralysin
MTSLKSNFNTVFENKVSETVVAKLNLELEADEQPEESQEFKLITTTGQEASEPSPQMSVSQAVTNAQSLTADFLQPVPSLTQIDPLASGGLAHEEKEASVVSQQSASSAGLPAEAFGEATASTATTATFDNNIDGLLIGTQWSSRSISFSFTDSIDDYETGYPSRDGHGASFQALNATQQAVAREWIGTGGEYFNVSLLSPFELIGAGDRDATIRMAMSNVPGTAFAYYPGGTVEAGDAWFNTTSYNNPVIGTFAYHTFGHELGHALGLKHGHEGGGVRNVTMNADRDSMEFSIMTYRSYVGQDLGALGFYTNEFGGYAQSLMMYDIAAIQHMYGAWFGYNSTSTTYTFSTTTGEMFVDGVGQGTPVANRVFRTVWDGNGIDTYDFSNYTTNLAVDLNPGGWSDLDVGGNFQRAALNIGYGGITTYARGHLFNAFQSNGDARSLIENANGGSGNDILTGNIANNILSGNSGADTLDGGSGSDQLFGGAGNDYINVTSLGNDTFNGGDGDDFIFGSDADEYYYGDAGKDTLLGYFGNDYINGGGGNDSIDGSSGNDSVEGGDGNDLIYLGTGDDYVNSVRLGNDTFYGGDGNDDIFGFTGNERYYGEAGNDTLRGDSGNDLLDGGGGDDSLSGGSGNDTYVVDSISDVISETSTLVTEIDTVQSSIIWGLDDNLENLILTGSAPYGFGNTLNNRLTGNSTANFLHGGGGADRLIGADGNDSLIGSDGNDILTGGNGADRFIFNAIRERRDTITDFVAIDDTVAVYASGFGGGLVAGVLSASKFVLGSAARDTSDRFIYNKTTGGLFFDRDGTGAAAALEIATLSTKPTITNADILVV